MRVDHEERQLLVSEGLIRTYPPSMFTDELVKYYRDFPRAHIHVEPKNVIILQYTRDISKEAEFQRVCKLTGYTVVHVSQSRGSRYPYQLTLEPRWSGEVPDRVIPALMYHVVPASRLHKVLQLGLTPRESRTTFHHTGYRIYLLVSSDPNKDIPVLVRLLRRTRNHSELYAVLTVDTSDDHTYYFDPSMQLNDISTTCYGVFTLRNILPINIKHVGNVS